MKALRCWFGISLFVLMVWTVWSDAQPAKKDSKPPADEPMVDLSEEEAKELAIAERFRKVLDTNPRRGTALDRLYGYHVERGALEKLIAEYTARIKADEKDGKAWLIVGLLESQRGKDAAAVAALSKAEEHLPDNAIPSYYLGQSLVLVGQPEKAAEAFERAITRKPNRNDLLDIFQALGRVYQRSQRSAKALDVWNRLEKLFPDDARVQEQIASTLVEEGEFAQALPRLEKLAKATEDNYRQTSLKIEIADLKVRLKRTPEALADFEKLTSELNPESWLYRDVRRRIEDVFLKNDDLAGLAKYYEKWLEKNPTDIDAIARLAKNLSSQGRAADAQSWLEKGIAVAPSNRALRQALIDQYVYEQKYTAAAAQYELLDKNDPGNPDILRDWGRMLMRDSAKPEADRKAAASAIWKRILEKKPKDAVITSQVADLMRGANITDDAIALYRKAIELAPDAAQYREYLGEYFHSLKRSDEALATWRPIAEGANRNSKNLNRLAEVFAGFGYRKEAIATMTEAVKLEGNDFTMRMTLAEFLHADSQHDEALKEIEASIKLVSNPEESEQILIAQIKIYQATEMLVEQINLLEKQLGDGKNVTGDKLLRLARLYEASRQPEKATEATAKAAEKDPKSIAILIAAARIHEAGGNMLAASDANRKLASLDRRFRTEYLQAVAKLEQRLGRREQAMQAGRDLLAASPGNPDVYKFFAELCFQLGDQDEGLEALRRSVRANPSEPSGLITLANALIERLRQGEAIELLWRAFEKTTDLEGRLTLIDRLASLYLENNQFDKLIERLERERREAEKSREFTICIAQAFQTAGDLGTARSQLERLLTENNRDGVLLNQLVMLCEKEGDIGSALKYQRQLVVSAPSNTDNQLKLAQLLTRSGEADEAADIWVKLVAGETEPYRNLNAIDQLINAGKHDAALAILTRMLAQKPGNWELTYREGAALAAKGNKADAAKRFDAILAAKLSDDELGEQAKNQVAQQKKKQKANPKGSAIAPPMASRFNYDETMAAPLTRRTSNLLQIQVATGIQPESRYYGPGGMQQRSWFPADYGEARMACQGWIYEFARGNAKHEEFVKQLRAARDKPNAEPRVLWDYYYLQLLRNETKELSKIAVELSKANDPAGLLAFLNSFATRGQSSNRFIRRPSPQSKVDRTPPLPPDQIDYALECYRKLRRIKPEWVEQSVVSSMLLELKRSKRDADAMQIYQDVIDDCNTVARVTSAIGLAVEREDFDAVYKLFEKLQKLQGPVQAAARLTQLPTRQVSHSFITAMGKQMDAKQFDAARKTLDFYLTTVRKENLTAPRSNISTRRGNQGAQGVNLYSRGTQGRYQTITYPNPNEYYDTSAINVLYNAYDLHREADLLSDLHEHFRKQIESAQGAEKLYLHLGLGYLYWWGEEKEQALNQMTLAIQAVPSDHNLLLEVAALREQNNEFSTALELLDSITPLDHLMMQRREEAALRVAERTGNVERARESANRLFGMRLDAEKQLELAGKMHRLGLHEMAETVLGRSHRQAGNNTATLLRLMNQYQSQNQGDLAVQIARQILRKAPAAISAMGPRGGGGEEDRGRSQAIGVLARSGQLKELVERAEAQLKASPKSVQIHQTLMDYYRAAGEKQKQTEIALKLVEFKPDDGRFRYSIAQQLHDLGDTANAMIQYREAIKREPMLFQYSYWRIEQLFSQAGKYEELSQLMDEIDLRKIGQPYYVMNMIEQLMQNENTQQMGMKLFRKAWAAFPNNRNELMQYIREQQLRSIPEIYDYLREAVIPRTDTEADPWSVLAVAGDYSPDGRIMSPLGHLLSIARKQHRLDELRKEIAEVAAKKPEWHGGKAILAIIDIQTGKKDEGLKALRTLYEDKKSEIPGLARFVLAQELEYYSGAEQLAVEMLEGGVDDVIDAEFHNEFEYQPIRRLVWWYQQLERHEDARRLLLRVSKTDRVDPGYGGGYWQYLQINQKTSIARNLIQAGDPIEAIRIYSEIFTKPEDIAAASTNYGGGRELENQLENGFRSAIKALKPETLPTAMKTLLTPRTEKDRPVLDLVIVIESRELSKAKIASVYSLALRATEKSPELRMEADRKLAELGTQYSKDFSVQIALAVRAFLDDKLEVVDLALERLTKLLDAAPLEALPDGSRANARQRDQARQQIALWLVARECLQKGRDKHVEAGRKLAERAVAASKRQIEPIYAQAILREWGELEIARGDQAQGEARMSEMLQLLLPKPSVKKDVEKKTPVKAPTTPATPVPTTGEPQSKLDSKNHLAERDEYSEFVLLQAPPRAIPLAPPTANSPALTIEQFQQIFEYAKVAAEKKLPELSMKAMKEAFKGGPPKPNKDPDRGGFSYSTSVIGGVTYYVRQDALNQISPDAALSTMVSKWRALEVPAAAIYDMIASAVFPEARPAEVFLSFGESGGGDGRYYILSTSGSLQPAGFDPGDPGGARELSELVVQLAIEAKQADDLKKLCESRLGQPLGELPAIVLLFLLAVELKEDAKALESLKKLDLRIQKDTLSSTLALVSTAATKALERPALEAGAADLMLKIALGYAKSNNPSEAANIGTKLIEHKLSKNDRDGAKKLIDMGRTLGKALAGNDPTLHTRLGSLYLKAGYVEDGLDEFGLRLDAQTSGKMMNRNRQDRTAEPECEGFVQLYKGLQELPAAKRYEVLKNWSMPTSGRKSLRYFVGNLPTRVPPPEFAKFPNLPSDPITSTLILLLDSAKEAGKIDELLAAADQLVKDKIENAEILRVLAYLSCGKGKAIEADIKQFADVAFKRMTAKAPPRAVSRYDQEQHLIAAFRPSEYLFAKYCLADAAFYAQGEKLSPELLRKALETNQGAVHPVRELNDQIVLKRHSALAARDNGLPAHWQAASPKDVWFAQDGLLTGNLQGEGSTLLFESPLIGSYEFSVEIGQAIHSNGYVGASGLMFRTTESVISELVGSRNLMIMRQPPALRPGEFNKVTVRVTPKKMTCLINDKVWYEDVDPAPTSPWLMLLGISAHRPVFRNFTLSGNPEIPSDVKLLSGDYLEGWLTPFYTAKIDGRIVLRDQRENPQRRLDRFGRVVDPDEDAVEQTESDWEAKDGVLMGRRMTRPTEQFHYPAHLSYIRPLRAGDSISCEFFHKAGVSHIDPCLGQLAFILNPDGVKWHWLLAQDENPRRGGGINWMALKPDHAIDAPAGYNPKDSKVTLKENDWNSLKLSVMDKTFRLELNGKPIHEGPIPEGVETTFGVFHYRNRTSAKVRNVVLTGDWPKKLEKLGELGFVSKTVAAPDAKARRELIDERNFTMDAGNVLSRSRNLPPEQRYRLLADWILPTETRPAFQVGGTWRNNDVLGIVDQKDQPPGKRVMLGGAFESPVLELIKVAKELRRLDDLAKLVDQIDVSKGDATFQRCQSALQILILAAQEKDEAATAKLNELTKAVEAMAPDARPQHRWPMLLAAVSSIDRPALVKPAVALADSMSRNIQKSIGQNQSFDDRDWWFRVFRFVRARGQIKALPEETRRYGDNDLFAHWTAAQGVTPTTRNGTAHIPHWRFEKNALYHYPGHGDDYLILNTPLIGDFELTCELLLKNWQESFIRYAGAELRLDTDRKSFKLSTNVGSEGRKMMISPPLKDQTSSKYAFRMSVKNGTVSYFIDEQQVHSQRIGPNSDPWLMIRSNHPNTGEVRDLKITGNPKIPDRIVLSAADEFQTWRLYQGNGALTKRGEEMYHFGGKQRNLQYDPEADIEGQSQEPRTLYTECAFYYQRPIVEDGAVEYEFYFSPDKTMVHPMLDRLVFLLEPEGVKLHWLTDGAIEKSGLLPTNSKEEPECRRGPKTLPLKSKAWNRLRMQVTGDVVKLILNDVEVYERPIEATNQRLFGLFHYADKTELRVRGMVYEGKWEKELPTFEKLFELKKK